MVNDGVFKSRRDPFWAGTERWIATISEEPDMRINANIRDCVVFVGKTDRIEDLEATAFFATVESHLTLHSYLVTARHVADGLGDEFFIRINMENGKSQWEPIVKPKWHYHPDTSVDAALLVYRPPKGLHLTHIPTGAFFPPDDVYVGAGDEISYPGLLWEAAGLDLNLSLIRTGNLAMMPGEKIYTGYGRKEYGLDGYALVYLAEVRSIRGLSGSPVFARETVDFNYGGKFILSGNGSWRFVGMMQGHWLAYKQKPPDDPEGVSAGISCIIPAHLILDIINSPRLEEMRKNAEKEPPQNMQPIRLTSRSTDTPTQETHAPRKKDRIHIPIPTAREVMEFFRKATRKRR